MKLAPAFDGALAAARISVKHAVGHVLLTTVEAMGYVIVPVAFVNTFRELLRRDDEKQAAAQAPGPAKERP